MLSRSLIMAIFAATALPTPCTAEGRVVPDSLVVAIAAWVTEATDLPMPGTLPEIRFAAPEDMGLLMRAAALSPMEDGALEIVAFYDTPARAI
jgi:hypothetical protein